MSHYEKASFGIVPGKLQYNNIAGKTTAKNTLKSHLTIHKEKRF